MSKVKTERFYKLTFQNGSTYYGRTILEDKRYDCHKNDVKSYKHHNKHIQEIYNKYGYDGWVHEWLFYRTGTDKELGKVEFKLIQADPKALNIHDGKRALLSEEEKKKYHKDYSHQAYHKNPEHHKTKIKIFKENNKERLSQERKDKRANMTPEEHAEYRRKENEGAKRRRREKNERKNQG